MPKECKSCKEKIMFSIVYTPILPGIEVITRFQNNFCFQYIRIGERRYYPYTFSYFQERKGLIEYINYVKEK